MLRTRDLPIAQSAKVNNIPVSIETVSADSAIIEKSMPGERVIANSKIQSRLEFGLKQQQDKSLEHLFDLARTGNAKYFIEEGIL